MKTADLVTAYCEQTFRDHSEAIEWLERNCKQLELDAAKSALKLAAKVAKETKDNREVDYDMESTEMLKAILALAKDPNLLERLNE